MEIRRITKAIKTKLRYGFIVEWYNFWYLALRKKHHIVPKIASIDNTIDKIIQSADLVMEKFCYCLIKIKASAFKKQTACLAKNLKKLF